MDLSVVGSFKDAGGEIATQLCDLFLRKSNLCVPPVVLTIMKLNAHVSLRLREATGGEGGAEAAVVTDTSDEASCGTLTKELPAPVTNFHSLITRKRFNPV